MKWTTVLVAVALSGCTFGDDGGLAPPASATMVAAREGRVIAVDVDEGTVTRLDPATGESVQLEVGAEPTRIARAGDRVFVTLRGEGALAVLRDGDALSVEERVTVGAEPYGVVATSDGSRVYVAVSQEDVVVELDGKTLEKLREFAVIDQPRWLALNRAETALFVGSTRDGQFSRIDLDSGEVSTIELPETGGEPDPGAETTGVDQPPGAHDHHPLTPRVTGDPVVTPDGDTVAVPVLYEDNHTPVTSDPEDPKGGGYAADDVGDVVSLSRLNPALVLIPIDPNGKPTDVGRAVFLGAERGGRAWRSYPNAVTAVDDRYFAVSMEASDAVLVVDSEPYRGQGPDDRGPDLEGFIGRPPQNFNFWIRPITPVKTGAGPRSVLFDGDTLIVHDFLDRDVTQVAWEDARAINAHEADDKKQHEMPFLLDAGGRHRLAESSLDPVVEHGRRLFYSATDKDITSRSGGVSCATCHFDGRDDGLTWTFRLDDGSKVRLQTPSLAGRVDETAPLTWAGLVPSVADEALLTSTLRMGGHGPEDPDLLAIEAYVDSTRLPLVPEQDGDLVARGAELFQRADVGCSSCHAGLRATDNLDHDVAGMVVNTPTLSGVAATGPYLHDGSMKTLRDVLEWTRTGAMGDTSMLSDADLDALEAYLRSL